MPTARSQAGRKWPDLPIAPVTSSDLEKLRQELSQSFSVFGLTLKRAMVRQAKKGLSKPYVIDLCSGRRAITPEIARAFWRIAAAHDGVDPTTATAQAVTVYAVHDIRDALITGKAQKCARPGCPIRFVKTHPRQKYHSPFCGEQNRKVLAKCATSPKS